MRLVVCEDWTDYLGSRQPLADFTLPTREEATVLSSKGVGTLEVKCFRPKCSVCDETCSRIEIIPSGKLPVEWNKWDEDERRLFNGARQRHAKDGYTLIRDGIETSNGTTGDPIDEGEALAIVAALTEPYQKEKLAASGLHPDDGLCTDCGKFYCYNHWGRPQIGYGRCPNGHGRSLDPHWHPPD